MRAAILALLREEPRNGYQIMSEIEQRSGGAWRPSPGAVYPALAQLADEGLIAGVESGGRRTFRLTEAGQRHIADNPETARAAWEAMAEGPPGEVRGLLVQAARLGGSVAQIAHAGSPEQIRAAGELLAATRRGIYQILAGDADGDGDGEGDGYGDDYQDEHATATRTRVWTRTCRRRRTKPRWTRGLAMDEHIRASDADRDRITARLQEHFAEGRLTRDELDERVTTVLRAKTFGELRPVLADLPEPVPAPRAALPQPAGRPWPGRRHRVRLAPLFLLLLLTAVLLPPGGWLVLALLKVVLLFWFLAMLAGVLVAGRIRRRFRQDTRAGYRPPWGGGPRWR